MTLVANRRNWMERLCDRWRVLLVWAVVFGTGRWMLTEAGDFGWPVSILFGFHLALVALCIAVFENADPLGLFVGAVVFTLCVILVFGWQLWLGVGLLGSIFVGFSLFWAAQCFWTFGLGKTLAVRRANAWLLGREMPTD
ncbi:MAG: hypothetical protein AAFR79_18590 [Pseudomonadota bacterium]